MTKKIQISTQEICDLISRPELPRHLSPWYKSISSFQPLSMPWNMVKGSCVELQKDTYRDLHLYVLNQSSPIGYGASHKSFKKDLELWLSNKDNGLYEVDNAVAFRHGYKASTNPESVSLIFNTAVECVKDLVERGQTRYQEDRFSQLKRDLQGLA